MSRTIRIGRRTLPLWVLVAAIVIPTIAVSAWGILYLYQNAQVSATATAAQPAPTMVFDPPTCLVEVGTGTVTKCAKKTGEQGFDVVVSGISSNSADGNPTRLLVRQFARNTSAFAACGAITFTPRAGVTYSSPMTMSVDAGGYSEKVFQFDYFDIQPGQTVSVDDFSIAWAACP